MEELQPPLHKPYTYDDYDEVSSFDCASIESPSSAASIFDELVFTNKLDLHKFLDDMATFHDCIDDRFNGMTKRIESLASNCLRHRQLLESSLSKSDAMSASLEVMRSQVDHCLQYIRPEKEPELIEVKVIPSPPPIYSSEYIDNYMKKNQNESSYKAIVAIVAMLLYVVFIRDRSE
ncbi:uncharacterized protein CXQ87_004923 [Candidozyma duobushaemuli]|uniref:Uncharacterized protein n=1 Tax=Candidozyma duobushaemuli TaxID=1231522 RepID=A0A2V1AFD0_9ASCO|nr:uncharacterized protein CXQ87_004923 [[Candida] duobushaemulonis]PVH16628.1 hypothetical protein CXQ87_004923 [[Candida] duobushaemulonis]